MALVRCDDSNAIILKIRQTLDCLIGILGVCFDMESVDYIHSAAIAMEREIAFEGSEEDADDEHKQAVRFVLSAVYFGGSPVVDDSMLEAVANFHRCCFADIEKGEFKTVGSMQLVRNDLMIVSVEEIKVGQAYFHFINEKPAKLIVVDEVCTDSISFHNPTDWFRLKQTLNLSACGILPHPDGTWNVWNWLEPVGPKIKE